MSGSVEITEDGLKELVHRFYAKVRRDPEIGPLFNAVVEDWDEHLAKLTDFWSSVTLASGRYKGSPMMAHIPHAITPRMFDRWLELWGETVGEIFAPPAATVLCAKAARMRLGLQSAVQQYSPAFAAR
jgi:hemoglobin